MKPVTYTAFATFCSALLLFFSCAQPDPSLNLKPLVEGYVAAWNSGNFENLEDVVSVDFELRMTPQFHAIQGIDSLKNTITRWRTGYPDFTLMLDEVVYAKEVIAVRWTIQATNSGPGPYPPTGKTIKVPGMSILHVSNGRIVDEWIASNDLFWLLQLGFELVPPQGIK